jgi:hypothetical protein
MALRSIFLVTVSVLTSIPITNASPAQIGTLHQLATRAYSLVDSYTSDNFFSEFSYFLGTDPTAGDVVYEPADVAVAEGLTNTNNGQIYMGVDHTTVNPPGGRPSVRLTSNKVYNHGLFIADIAHMPDSACGVWPAFWTFGTPWPFSGEIDILEGVNTASTNQITLHTGPGCTVNIIGSLGGTTLVNPDCNLNSGHDGCSVTTTVPNSVGTNFNNIGGGVYAMQWADTGIYVWFFPRGSIPTDITDGQPMTANWGTPVVAFNGGSGCNIDNSFSNQNIVFDTTFCGNWAGQVFESNTECAALATSCNAYVDANPGAFANAYWLVNSVKVYQ